MLIELNPDTTVLFFLRQFWLTKWSFLVHSNMRNAPYIHPSHDWILELWQTFPNVACPCLPRYMYVILVFPDHIHV